MRGVAVRFEPAPPAGVHVVEMERFEDERGFFAYSFDRAQFERLGLSGGIVQSNVSFNRLAGTLRGMHYQKDPAAQPKLVRCTAGAIYDVVIDLRRDSPTHRNWFGVELSAANRRALYIPAGFAHGFLTLRDETEVLYDMFNWYAPQTAAGVRYDDPAFGIEWPRQVTVISERDRTYPDYPTDPAVA